MKILFPDVKIACGGKSYFLHALYRGLEKLGLDIVFDGPHDIQFASIRYHTKSKAKKVLRLDGVYHNIGKANMSAKNEEMKRHADAADVIICQSQFGKKMVQTFVGVPDDKIIVIGNGADPNANTVAPVLVEKHNFLAVSKWRPHKRLPDIIESFIIANDTLKNSRLHVVGDAPEELNKYGTNKSVTFHGSVFDRPRLYGLMKSCTASIHLCWFDCFPNSVVEAVCMGCPVICNNTGGTHEIVGPSGGVVLNLDEPYNYKPVHLYNPPSINRRVVAKAMVDCANNRPEITPSHVLIDSICKQYYEVFKSL